MNRVFKSCAAKAAGSLAEVEERMVVLGASPEECTVVRQTVEAFLRWSGRRDRKADREAGLDWLGEVRHRLVPEQYDSVKAGLTTWFHLTGGVKKGVGDGVKGESGQPLNAKGVTANQGGGELSQGGRVSGEAGSWKEAGARFKGFLACKNYSRNTMECYVGWARRFCRWCMNSGRMFDELEAGEIRAFLEWLAGTGVVGKTQNDSHASSGVSRPTGCLAAVSLAATTAARFKP